MSVCGFVNTVDVVVATVVAAKTDGACGITERLCGGGFCVILLPNMCFVCEDL